MSKTNIGVTMSIESQNKMIRKRLERGLRINPLQALSLYQCQRLAARIKDLRYAGMAIQDRFITNPATKKRYKEYWL